MRKFLLIVSVFAIIFVAGCSEKTDTNKPARKEKTEISENINKTKYSALSREQFKELIDNNKKGDIEKEKESETQSKEDTNIEPSQDLHIAQEIVLIPQGQGQVFPDIKLIQSTLNSAPIRDCIYYPDSYTPLMKAIEKEDFDKIAELIKDGEDINKILSGGGENCPDYKPLLIGVLTGNKELISYLV